MRGWVQGWNGAFLGSAGVCVWCWQRCCSVYAIGLSQGASPADVSWGYSLHVGADGGSRCPERPTRGCTLSRCHTKVAGNCWFTAMQKGFLSGFPQYGRIQLDGRVGCSLRVHWYSLGPWGGCTTYPCNLPVTPTTILTSILRGKGQCVFERKSLFAVLSCV